MTGMLGTLLASLLLIVAGVWNKWAIGPVLLAYVAGLIVGVLI